MKNVLFYGASVTHQSGSSSYFDNLEKNKFNYSRMSYPSSQFYNAGFYNIPRVKTLTDFPDIIFFDEPSAGLDPINARKLDDLILELRDGLGTTVVVITHELASIFAIGNNSVFLDAESKTMIASGDPNVLLSECKDYKVIQFLTRGKMNNEKKSQ